jgi:hypothetical protein
MVQVLIGTGKLSPLPLGVDGGWRSQLKAALMYAPTPRAKARTTNRNVAVFRARCQTNHRLCQAHQRDTNDARTPCLPVSNTRM